MGHRLSRIYTRTGDKGTTGLGGGSRVSKDSPRTHAIGEVDELNSLVGLLLVQDLPANKRDLLTGVKHDLFDLGGDLSIPGMTHFDDGQVGRLECELDAMNGTLEPLKDFILPGEARTVALVHQARAVCCRVERVVVALTVAETVREAPRQYLNRLSDLLFVLACFANRVSRKWRCSVAQGPKD